MPPRPIAPSKHIQASPLSSPRSPPQQNPQSIRYAQLSRVPHSLSSPKGISPRSQSHSSYPKHTVAPTSKRPREEAPDPPAMMMHVPACSTPAHNYPSQLPPNPSQFSPSPFEINIIRENVKHIIFLDLDNVPDFFRRCDDATGELCTGEGPLKGITLIPNYVFVWCFYNSHMRLPQVTFGSITFYTLLKNKMIEFDPPTSKDKNSADNALAVTMGMIIRTANPNTKCTIVSEDSTFDEVVRRCGRGHDVKRFTRYLKQDDQGRRLNDPQNTHLDFFHHLYFRLTGLEVDKKVRYTKFPYNKVDYTSKFSFNSQVAHARRTQGAHQELTMWDI